MLTTWFGLQVLDGSAGLVNPEASLGVAYFAHIGGFLTGLVLVRLFDVEDLARGTGLQAPVQPFRPNARLEDDRLVVQA